MAREEAVTETLVRRIRPDQPLETVFVRNVDTGEIAEAAPDWIGISTVGQGTDEAACVYFCMDDGQMIVHFQFDTLEIAVDQAWEMTGVDPSRWDVCAIDLTTENTLAWRDLPAASATESE